VADTSAISQLEPEMDALTYRGYPVQDLVQHCSFEEVAYLIWQGELPDRIQLKDFRQKEILYRNIKENVIACVESARKRAHPIDSLILGVTVLGMADADELDHDKAADLDRSMKLMGSMPTLIAADYRLRNGKEPIPPNKDLGTSENFFYMCFGELTMPEIAKAFDASLILYAEHTFNPSTFAARVIASTLSDIYSGVIGGLCALKGKLHGGANENVMYMLKEIGTPSNAERWLQVKLNQKERIPGFGHRVYNKGDCRYLLMKKHLLQIADLKKDHNWVEISELLEEDMLETNGIYPNLDLATGPLYHLMGFDADLYTPIFAMARVVGWTAHIMEQYVNNKIIRPLSLYTGPPKRDYVPIQKR